MSQMYSSSARMQRDCEGEEEEREEGVGPHVPKEE